MYSSFCVTTLWMRSSRCRSPPRRQPPFHLNQFGASLRRANRSDKTFFFVAYEGYRQHWGFPLLGYVPSDAFRAQVAADSPVLAPILNAYPKGEIPTSNPDINEFASEGMQVVSGEFRDGAARPAVL